MNDRRKIKKVLDLIQKSGVRDEHVTPDEMYEAMSEYNLLELAEGFSLFVNLIADIKDVLEKDDLDIKKSAILEVTLLTVEEAEKLPKELCKANMNWWLRSPGDCVWRVAYMDGDDGNVYVDGRSVGNEYGVRPVLKLNSSLFTNMYYFSYKGYRWDVIDTNMALCRTIVGKSVFRKYVDVDDANDYESSDIKKWLNDWWTEVMK